MTVLGLLSSRPPRQAALPRRAGSRAAVQTPGRVVLVADRAARGVGLRGDAAREVISELRLEGRAPHAARLEVLAHDERTPERVRLAHALFARRVRDEHACAVEVRDGLRPVGRRRAFVLMQFYGYLRRDPDEASEPGRDFAGYHFWLGKLNEFNGDFIGAEMVKAFLSADEHRKRFGQ